MFLSSEIRYTLNYLLESTATFLNYLFMVKVKVTEAINRLKMCNFFSYLRLHVLSCLGTVCPSHFLMHAISFESCIIGF